MSLILKDEIKRNLPKLNINKNDLYIYIRAGDLFSPNIYNGYIPYPYCFYEKVITNFKFNDIYIISIGKKPCHVISPIIAGLPPEPRMNCKMEFILDYDFIIIHGGIGKNDSERSCFKLL